MQYGASKHLYNKIKAWLSENNVPVLDLKAKYPDIKIRRNLWGVTACQV